MFNYLPLIVILLESGIGQSESSTIPVKCCDDESILNEGFACEKMLRSNTVNGTHFDAFVNVTDNNEITHAHCFKQAGSGEPTRTTENPSNHDCVDVVANGTRVRLVCNLESVIVDDTSMDCDSVFTRLNFWGATIVVFATIVYNVPFVMVVIIYSIFSELRTRAYDKAVLCYNVLHMAINLLMITMGFYTLCHKTLSVTAYRLFGIGFMFTVQGVVIWTLIICFDMTLVITRFRWAPKGGIDRGREEKRKFYIYSAWAWGFSSFLTAIPAFVEFTRIFPEDSPIRPNYHNFRGTNIAVNIYTITGPALVCLTTTSLFIYTTVKTIAVQKSTAIANENRKTNVTRKYLLFLKLYLVMDTPWLTAALAAIYDNLWVLKFLRIVQPMIMLMLILPRKRILRAMKRSRVDAKDRREVVLRQQNNRRKTNVQV